MNWRIRKKVAKRKKYKHYRDFYKDRWRNYMDKLETQWKKEWWNGSGGPDCVVIETTGGNYKSRLVLSVWVVPIEKYVHLHKRYRDIDWLHIFKRGPEEYSYWAGGLNTSHMEIKKLSIKEEYIYEGDRKVGAVYKTSDIEYRT